MNQINKKFFSIVLIFLAIIVALVLVWSRDVPAAAAGSATGTLNIQVIPAGVVPVTINGSQTVTGPNGTLVVPVSAGLQEVVFGRHIRSSLIVPAPPVPFGFSLIGSTASPTPSARQIFVGAGESQTIVGRYFQPADLKPIQRSEVEVLEYDPARAIRGNTIPRWGLLKGVASVSVDNGAVAEGVAETAHWQYSAAELLFIGAEDYLVDLEKTDGKSFIVVGPAGTTNDYTIDFNAISGPPEGYSAIVVDNISVEVPVGVDVAGELAKIRITSASGGVINSDHQATYAISGLSKNIPRTIRLGITIDEPLAPGTRIINTAQLSIENGAWVGEVADETVVLNPFIRETAGGNIFARGGARLSNPNLVNRANVLYTIGSTGNADAVSSSGWVVSGYSLRHDGQLINYDAQTRREQTNCSDTGVSNAVRESGWCLMKGNTDKLINGAVAQNTSGFDGKLNPGNVPEGGSRYFTRGMTVSGTTLRLQGKGTVVVDGDLVINSNMIYTSSSDIAGFIVRNGNVIIGPEVTRVDGFFYIFADSNISGKGRFIVQSRASADAGAYDSQLVVKGSVVASGYYSPASNSRVGAFELNRNYAGPLDQLESGAISPEKGNIPPAEDFQYDARIVTTPPPGFSRDVFRGRQ